MNPTTNLRAQLQIAQRLVRCNNDQASVLAALVLELNNWLEGCGDLPDQWKAGQNAYQLGAEVEDNTPRLCGTCGHYSCTCIDMGEMV